MKELLLKTLESEAHDWNTWISTFDKFVNYGLRDSNEKMYKYKDTPSYCTWKITDEYIMLISYKYVHILTLSGDMYCLQEYTEIKNDAINNFKLLDPASYLPILVEHEVQNNLLYTKFCSPTDTLGYPSSHILFNIMLNSNDVIKDFNNYITQIINNYFNLTEMCISKNLPFYNINRILTNNFLDHNIFYFKDSAFFVNDQMQDINKLEDVFRSSIDGFKRAEGIINTYRQHKNYKKEVVSLLFLEIEKLKDYVSHRCQNLKNANLQ